MSISQRITETLATRKGFGSTTPETVICADEQGLVCELDLTAVDSLSCSFRELRIVLPESARPFAAIQHWGDEVARRVTYLLEHVGVLEQDGEQQSVLIRSVPPDRQPEQTTYYELLVRTPGTALLRRYQRGRQETERRAIDSHVTQEVLQRLVRDITAAAEAA